MECSVVNPAALVLAVLRAIDVTIILKLDRTGKAVSTLIALQYLDRYSSLGYIFVLLSSFFFPAVVEPSIRDSQQHRLTTMSESPMSPTRHLYICHRAGNATRADRASLPYGKFLFKAKLLECLHVHSCQLKLLFFVTSLLHLV